MSYRRGTQGVQVASVQPRAVKFRTTSRATTPSEIDNAFIG